MPAWAYALLSVAAISFVSLAGVSVLAFGRQRLERVLFLLVAFAVGAMFGGAVLHLIPEAYAALGPGLLPGLLVLAGVGSFFVLEKFLHWHHAHDLPGGEDGGHLHGGHSHGHHHARGAPGHVAAMSLAGNVAHNFIDGAIVAASYLVSVETGLVTTLAVVLHEIPQEIGNFGILVYGGYTPRRALAVNFASGLAGLLGAGVAIVAGQAVEGLANVLLPFTAGGFLYIAGSDLIPELNLRHSHTAAKSAWQLVMMALGVALMTLPLLLEG
ncbi:MAG TPA: ZIP family metal transporter [Rubricoccaceae bacterium]